MISENDYEYIVKNVIPAQLHRNFKSGGKETPLDVGSVIARPSFIEMPFSKRKQEESYVILASLNIKQRRFVYHVLKLLKEDSGPFHLFLSGSAGAGKSYTLMVIEELVNRLFADSSDSSTVLLMSPSEETAALINGKLLHECLAIPTSLSSMELPKLSAETANFLRSKLKSVKLVIIDEVSSIGKHLISHVNTRLKEIFDVSSDFADLSVILAGDLRQGSPDVQSPIFQNTKIWHKFQFYEFQKSFRQGSDPKFERVLKNLRNGELSRKDLTLLNSRIRYGVIFECPTFLFCGEELVDCFNENCLNEIIGEKATSEAVDVISGPGNKADIAKLQEYYKLKPLANVKKLPQTLTLKENARYMITHDIDRSDGLIVGVIGYLRFFVTHNKVVEILYFEFDDKKTGAKARKEYQTDRGIVKEKWVPIKTINATVPYDLMYNLTLTRSQFPVLPAEAMQLRNVHGRTLGSACIFLQEEDMTANLLYSALSRVKTLTDLYLVGTMTNEHAVIDNVLSKELLRLRDEAALKLRPLKSNQAGDFSVYFHNIEDLKLDHRNLTGTVKTIDSSLKGMLCDPSVQEHDVLIFSSSRLAVRTVIDLVIINEKCGFSSISSWDRLKSSTLLVLSKLPLQVISKSNYTGKVSMMALSLKNLIIVPVSVSINSRISRGAAKKIVKNFIARIPKNYNIIIIGTLNFKLEDLNTDFQKVVQTADHNLRTSHSSVIYTNFEECTARVYSSLFTLYPSVYIQASKKLIELPIKNKMPDTDDKSQFLTKPSQSLFPPNDHTAIPSNEENAFENEEKSKEETKTQYKIPEIVRHLPETNKSHSVADANKNKRKSCHIARSDSLSDLEYLTKGVPEEIEKSEEKIKRLDCEVKNTEEEKVSDSPPNLEETVEIEESRDDFDAIDDEFKECSEGEVQRKEEENLSDGAELLMEVTEENSIEEVEMLNDKSDDLAKETTENAKNSIEEMEVQDLNTNSCTSPKASPQTVLGALGVSSD